MRSLYAGTLLAGQPHPSQAAQQGPPQALPLPAQLQSQLARFAASAAQQLLVGRGERRDAEPQGRAAGEVILLQLLSTQGAGWFVDKEERQGKRNIVICQLDDFSLPLSSS